MLDSPITIWFIVMLISFAMLVWEFAAVEVIKKLPGTPMENFLARYLVPFVGVLLIYINIFKLVN